MGRKFQKKIVSLGIVLALGAMPVLAQQYTLSGKTYEMTWPNGGWDGKYAFPGVFCVAFPTPDRAKRMVTGMFNRNAIHLVRTIYDQQIMAAIAVSVVPEGRDAEAEITKLADMYRQGESASGRSFGVERLTTGFGPTLGLKMKDIAPESRNGPFPLNIGAFYNPAKQPIESLSVHRVFVRGPDRIEVAVFQMAPQPAVAETEAEMTRRLTDLADKLVTSLQSCTSTMPVRTRQ
ncbi:hypothetical protein [Herbaspirillum rhizosphaerae]|uniref:hypothetical protein n=1 Tax=Herbaspirillum rhizosphaerae TaxID=346179 RepID=UPI00067ABBFB|nr:hypothetical protein [Herbaspirillum rhizosphaerae]